MKTRITLKELARLLNVSISTVSKALNNSPEISVDTIERVKELARLHNYKPNPTAVNLKSSKSGTVGVIIPNISNAFFAQVLSGIEEKALAEGFQIITYISDESWERERQITELLSVGFVDGILLAIAEETQRKKEFDHIQELINFGIPVVLYDRVDFPIPADKVGIDDRRTFFEATRKLQQQGMKKIGVATSIHHMGVGKMRIDGYRDALGREEPYYIANSAKMESLREKILILLNKKKVDALLCSDFRSTMMTYRLAYESGIEVPAKLKIIGFLNRQLAEYLTPSVSFVEQFPEEIGRASMEILAGRLKDSLPEERINKIIDTKLIELESTAGQLEHY